MMKDTKRQGLVPLTLLLLSVAGFTVSAHWTESSTSSTHFTTPAKPDRRRAATHDFHPPLEPMRSAEVDVALNDPALHENWGLTETATNQAWRISRGSRRIIVAVIDTGIDVNHPDLAENLWINAGESGLDASGRDRSRNGVDDDGNGLVDDVHGWNFSQNSPDLTDHHGHGTHIAGIIGAVGGNGIGISGVAPEVSLMILKYYDPRSSPGDALESTVQSILYAVSMGAHIINYSGGGLQKSDKEKAAIRRAQEAGILFVAAAGNERSDSDIRGYYPADYDLENILSVTAIDRVRTILPTSNYGARSVDLAAPGQEIYSTLPGGSYGRMTGTSQATAFASGVAALLMARSPGLRDPEELIEYLVQTGEKADQLVGKTRKRSTLNSYRALAMQGAGVNVSGLQSGNAPDKPMIRFAGELHAWIVNQPR